MPAPKEQSRSSGAPAGLSPLDWARESGAAGEVLAVVERELGRRRRLRRRLLAGGALLLAMGGLGTGVLSLSRPEPAVTIAAHPSRLEVLRPRTERLPDGTVVELRDGAEIRADYAGALRRVALLRGEAFFQVAHDQSRPFIVTVAGVDVRAVGTAFVVRHEPANVAVLVTEGRVRVSGSGPSAAGSDDAIAPAVLLGAGQQVVVPRERFDAAAPLQEMTADERDAALAWRVPRLRLRATPLADVIAAFNAQPGSPGLRLAEPGLGRLPLSGVLRADNVGVLCRLLEDSYGLEMVRLGEETVIRQKNGSRRGEPVGGKELGAGA